MRDAERSLGAAVIARTEAHWGHFLPGPRGSAGSLMTCTVIVCQMEMSLTAAPVSPGRTPVAGEGSPQCSHCTLSLSLSS